MNSATALLFIVYTYVILSLIWARFTFFKIKSPNSRFSALLYDPVVAAHIGTTYYYMLTIYSPSSIGTAILASAFYIGALLLFWWGIITSKDLNYAFGNFSGRIIISGPFRFVRHPFYLSYILIWSTSTFLFNSLVLWITLIYLVAFYLSSARNEEKAILNSESASAYSSYCKETSMFIPRIKKWKN